MSPRLASGRQPSWLVVLVLSLAAPLSDRAASPEPSLKLPDLEGASHGFPILRNLQGGKLADGEFIQWVENDRIQIRNRYDFGSDHRVDESAAFRQKPGLVQEEWIWREFIAGTLHRQFEVDFRTGKAAAQKRKKNGIERWSEELKIEPGRTYAGIGFTLAIKSLRERLMSGERVELQAVGFTPKPRVVSVELSHEGLDQMMMSGRNVTGDRFVIRAKIPAVVKLVIKAPDTRIWLINPPPAGFLRWEGALAEPSDPVIRVDLLPGDPSGPAEPVQRKGD